jgi:haloalkane dehalogenase
LIRTLSKWVGIIALVLASVAALFGAYLSQLEVEPLKRSQRDMSRIWSNFPFESRYVSFRGSQLHYIDEGDPNGPVFLLLHGNPTSSYLWRDVIPPIVDAGGRVVALDNIGFGASDRPNISYTFSDHAEYLDGFIRELDLSDITLVVHDWGSAMGFDYAAKNEANVRAIIFMEAITKIPELGAMGQPAKSLFQAMRTPAMGELIVLGDNFFVERLLPMSVWRELEESELASYREPFPTYESRIPTLVWPRELPFDGEPRAVAQRVASYAEWLSQTPTPKLLLYVDQGALISPAYAEELAETWNRLDTIRIGKGGHFFQEDHGHKIGQVIAKWTQEELAWPDMPTQRRDPDNGKQSGTAASLQPSQ